MAYHSETYEKTAKDFYWEPLSRTVIAVLVVHYPRDLNGDGWQGDWAAYIDSVPGKNHEQEWRSVLQYGTKLDKKVAKAIFSYLNLSNIAWRE